MLTILISILFGFCIGIFSLIFAAWHFLSVPDDLKKTKTCESFQLPNFLNEELKKNGLQRKETCVSLNLMLQFFFQERQYDFEIRKWLTNMFSQEFSDLLKHKNFSKFFTKMEIQSLFLGSNFPTFKSITPVNIKFANSHYFEEMEFFIEIEYAGGFHITIDAISRLSKKATVKIKVVHLSGKARLKLSRLPFTHWSFSFYEEPNAKFEVDSSVLGRHIPHFRTIILNQLLHMLRRKHTLPYFKLRRAPLVPREIFETLDPISKLTEIVPSGKLTVNLIQCSRLQPLLLSSSIFCCLTLSEVPLVCAYETPVGIWIILDIVISKLHTLPVGMLLRSAEDNAQIVETVNAKSPAFKAGLRKNDILLSINGVPLISGIQAAKLLCSPSSHAKENGSSLQILVRLKRLIITDGKKYHDLRFSESTNNLGGQVAECSSTKPPYLDMEDSIYESSFGDISHKPSANSNDKGGDLGESAKSTPNSSCNSSPEMKRKALNLSMLSDLSPIPSEENTFDIQHQQKHDLDDKCLEQSCDPDESLNTDLLEKLHHSPAISFPSGLSTKNSPQSSKSGTPTSMLDFSSSSLRAEHRSLSDKKIFQKGRPLIKYVQSPLMEASTDPIINAESEFWLDEDSKYLNVCIWAKGSPLPKMQTDNVEGKTKSRDSRKTTTSSKNQKDQPSRNHSAQSSLTGNSDATVVGYGNFLVSNLLLETNMNSQGHAVKIASLYPVDTKCPEVVDHVLTSHKGFEPYYCYGDAMLSFIHEQQNKTEVKGQDKLASEDECPTDAASVSDDEESMSVQDFNEERDHDFKRTHFNSATQCDFCKKKIWLKDAFQCTECGITCHKKCMNRCEKATVCDLGGLRYRVIRDNISSCEKNDLDSKDMPEIITPTSIESVHKNTKKTPPPSPQTSRQSLGNLLSQVANVSRKTLKRTGSAHNLALPAASSEGTLSRSLPPSPQQTPRQSRKASICGNPFSFEEVENEDEKQHLDAMLERLMLFPHEERLFTLAKESSPQLYSNLPLQQRHDKVKRMLEMLQESVNREGIIRLDLARQEKITSENGDLLQRTKLTLQISECDNRTQALALLTLHFFSALKLCQDQMEENETH